MQWHPPGKMTLKLLPAEPTDLCQGPIVISNERSLSYPHCSKLRDFFPLPLTLIRGIVRSG